ncbi:hypothetical protein RJ639_037929 [Escallonia herrerae]|uniref:Fe2OG dioxygenase domain-containing protein n=1 Tax=Escallonia herrerae TaxID=1293975 RepID=A0AA89BA62_9ASTE|nr:hypothetical protein RJ639_037929 [Escallonia herrerae]
MVVATPNPIRSEKIRNIELPIIDLSAERPEVSGLIVRACQEFGFFKVINHGVSQDVIARMESQSLEFFAKPVPEKQLAGPANPHGYGSKNIGFNGDVGEVEYLLLSTNSASISQMSNVISPHDPTPFRYGDWNPTRYLIKFETDLLVVPSISCELYFDPKLLVLDSSAARRYVEAVRGLACEILELMAEGLWVSDTSAFSRLIRAADSDSLLRLNHYPPLTEDSDKSPSSFRRIGFGEHTDPQILTVLRSNGVGGLQISLEDGVWIPVAPDSSAFCVNVGDVLQAMTNGRFVSVRHRALANSYQPRMSMAYFGAPSLHARVCSPPELVTPQRPRLYRTFTWAEYKKAVYTLRLGDGRLNIFRSRTVDEE